MHSGRLLLGALPCFLLVFLGGSLFTKVSATPEELAETLLEKRAPLIELETADNSLFQELAALSRRNPLPEPALTKQQLRRLTSHRRRAHKKKRPHHNGGGGGGGGGG